MKNMSNTKLESKEICDLFFSKVPGSDDVFKCCCGTTRKKQKKSGYSNLMSHIKSNCTPPGAAFDSEEDSFLELF